MSTKTVNPKVCRSFAKPLLAAVTLGLGFLAAAPQPASADVFIGARYGGWGWHHHPYYPRRHFFFGPRIVIWGPPVYYGPPPLIYGPPVGPPVYAPGYGTVQPMAVNPASAPFRASTGLTCREFQTTITVGGQLQNAYGTACLQPDGQWKVVDR